MGADSFTLRRLLAWLDGDAFKGGARYVEFHNELVAYLKRNNRADAVAEDLADEALTRVDERLATSLLNEHLNSTEIADVTNLCRILSEEGAKNSPSPSRRIWSLLSPADRSLAAALGRAETFERSQRSRLSQALNVILCRPDFYRPEDFNSLVFRSGVKNNSLIEKLAADIARGLTELSQSEVETFNRRLLEAAYPQTIRTNLADTPDPEKLARCKHYAGLVLLEYQKGQLVFAAPTGEPGESGSGERVYENTPVNRFDPNKIEDEQEKRRRFEYQAECKRLKLSPRDSAILDLYFTGIIIRSPDDEPLSDREIKELRKSLFERFGVSSNTIRSIAHRGKDVVLSCAKRCLRRAEKK